jgi:formylglycine-generating enzyme required for sulfatase activity
MGDFVMGCDGTQGSYSCLAAEAPQHVVSLDAYYISTYEVTAAEYQACVTAGGCTAANTGDKCTGGLAGKENHPINCVTWYQAAAYCTWAGKRLPTEAEWEKAARAGDARIFPWGNTEPTCSHANYIHTTGPCVWDTSPVGSYRLGVSYYGAHDMAGNVWEWVSDWFGAYCSCPGGDCCWNPQGPPSGTNKIVHGGSWQNAVDSIRSSLRGGPQPSTWDNHGGFRCARTP